jgi:hypothetical protein
MKFKNEDNFEELKVDPVEKDFAQYKQKWLKHVRRLRKQIILKTTP